MPLRLTIEAKPGSKIPFIAVRAGMIIVAVRERAIDGRANAAIERAIAAWLGVGARAVAIVHGTSSRRKYVDITGVDPDVLARRIAACEGPQR